MRYNFIVNVMPYLKVAITSMFRKVALKFKKGRIGLNVTTVVEVFAPLNLTFILFEF